LGALGLVVANNSSDGFNEVRIAVIMLWAGVVFGLASIAGRFLAIQALTGGNAASTGTSLLLAGLMFIFIQARLIMRLNSGNGAVRMRILVLSVLRIVLYLPAFPQMLAVSTYLILPPIISAILQLGALFLLFTSPGSHWFASQGGRRRA
jgi:hypothetical protein